MKNLIVIITILSGLTFYLSSCGPDERMNCTVVCDSINSAPQDLLDYFVFNEGSYWVYQLKGTDTLDTLSFAGMNSEFFELKAGCNFGIRPCEMRYSMGFDHSNLDKFPPGNLKNGSSNEGYYITYSESRDQWDVSHMSGTRGGGVVGFFLAYPFELNQQFTEYRFLTDTNKSVTVPAGTFDCIVTEMIPKPDYAGFYEELIFSKNIGLIRYQLSKAQGVWELIDYHLQ